MSLPLGWIRDQYDERDWLFKDSRIAVTRALSSSRMIDYRPLDTPRVQLFNSCVGQAIAGAAALAMAIANTPITFPSAQYLYTGSRILSAPKGAPILDEGCSARNAMTWARDRGLIAENRWVESLENRNAVPPLDAFQEGECALLNSFYRIESGAGASDGVDAALRRGICPAFAMIVDTKYEQIGSAVYDGPGGSILGGHMQVVVGKVDDLGIFIIRNTWGASFGDGGYAYITRAAFDRMARDIWVVESAPQPR